MDHEELQLTVAAGESTPTESEKKALSNLADLAARFKLRMHHDASRARTPHGSVPNVISLHGDVFASPITRC